MVKVEEPQADELLRDLRRHRDTLRNLARGGRFELYHRASSGLRLTRDGSGQGDHLAAGRDDGVAVRAISPASLSAGFAAASGRGAEALSWAMRAALEAEGHESESVRSATPSREPRVDRDDGGLPEVVELEQWLDAAWDGLSKTCRDRQGLVAADAWVEVSTTIETLVGDTGWSTSRMRTRAWAMARVASDARRLSPRPLFAAARRWSGLRVSCWAELLAGRGPVADSNLDAAAVGLPVLVEAEAASRLVAALVRELHGTARPAGRPVGPGWVVEDDPGAEAALYGGSFDDAGFDASPLRLADGRRTLSAIPGPGRYRRASYRDAPRPTPAHLVVRAPQSDVPGRFLRVRDLALHPAGPDQWVLELTGAVEDRGRGRVGPGGQAWLRVAPGALVEACRAGLGPIRAFHNGVETPGLLFDSLRGAD